MAEDSDLLTSHGGLRTELADWFPLVTETGTPVPRTIIVPADGAALFGAYEGHPTAASEAIMQRVRDAADQIGYPAFIRTGLTSGKHSWKWTCHLDSEASVPRSVLALFEFQEMVFLPMIENFVVRELLPTTPLFYAFEELPITRERRYFARDGKVYDHHPYWPAGALDEHVGSHGRNAGGWEHTLATDSIETDEEVTTLTALTERAAAVLPGAWSLDWLHTDQGWVFIDAAWAENSYVMPGHERARLLESATTGAPR